MKSALNGGLQLSVLDGWWPEAYDGSNGWALAARSRTTTAPRTGATPPSSTGSLEDEVVPAFYERDEDGLPRRWLQMVRASLRTSPGLRRRPHGRRVRRADLPPPG